MYLHISRITCSSSEGATHAALGTLRACYVSWLHTRNIPSSVCEAPPEDNQGMLETCRGINF
jgi:hypothetical protein